jgi:hypothetical protein
VTVRVRFNPFACVNSHYGAPMGRHGHNPDMWDNEGVLYARHGGGDGCYDRGGAYWGHGDIYAVWTRGGAWCCYVDGVSSPDAAIAKVRKLSQCDC